ncbi:GntR family transcriptional regulator [Streptomyces sp. NEAU-Y11]|uniref:GntR family transcriptional regulator n=1 Tax=Streptomyces cucumeris TaxID=2962890 RepID=UPI0020C8FFA7|nr:GntR family transcriptional regulator [Streptomyces sp. NEAU-Y11]MCP9207117.1 GntR family transcriptional regulator [Streptomyces sp. NEAU-Y11]
MPKRYESIAEKLRQKIHAGDLATGARLPAETALAAEYRTSMPTMRMALGLLQAEGLIEKRHGSGNYVRKAVSLVEYGSDQDIGGAPTTAWSKTDAPVETMVSMREVDAADDVAALMKVPPGTRLVEYVHRRQRHSEPSPHGLSRSYVLRELMQSTPQLPSASQAPWSVLLHRQLGAASITLDRIEQRLSARPPTIEEARDLGIVGVGVSVLAIQRASIDTEGRTVEASLVVLSGNRAVAVVTTPAASR